MIYYNEKSSGENSGNFAEVIGVLFKGSYLYFMQTSLFETGPLYLQNTKLSAELIWAFAQYSQQREIFLLNMLLAIFIPPNNFYLYIIHNNTYLLKFLHFYLRNNNILFFYKTAPHYLCVFRKMHKKSPT